VQFRKDINGLRAIAVIAVVLFHFNASWMPGGFAGVDVFFVISGFLMTGIIFRGIEQENFSILKFYVARANRIIPALAVLCLVLLVFGWFYLTPLDYRALGKHVGSSMGFLSNIIYWRESGYFDAASHEKWLLHTWSLSAEWQFYIIYPLVLVAMRKFMSLKAMKATVLVGTVLGFIFCVIATYKWPNPAYYLLPTRAWEMMIGGVAYLYPLKLAENRKKAFEWVGLALIISSYIFITKENLWPGYLALIPVLGAFLLIQAQRNDSIVTGNIVFQSLGKWSYSIYLWHWPLVVAIYNFSLNEQFIYFGIILSVILGFISNRYVEVVKFRNDFKTIPQYFKCKPIYLVLFIGVLGSITFYEKGFLNRFDIPDIENLYLARNKAENYYRSNLMQAFSNNNESYDETFLCTLDGGNQNISSITDCLDYKLKGEGYLIIGDSHGRDFLHSLLIAYPNINFSMLHQSSCVPTEYMLGDIHCFKYLDKLRESFISGNKKIKGIIFASLYGDDEGLKSLVGDIENNLYGDIPIYLVNAGPRLDKDIVDLAIKNRKVKDYYLLTDRNSKAIEINNKLDLLRHNIVIFDKYSAFCKDDSICHLNEGTEPYIWDGDHLSLLGIKKVSQKIKEDGLIKEAIIN
jgi:peptidoglycan/LPS O-acetylase OafA/YrhL